jgi:signal peptidase I
MIDSAGKYDPNIFPHDPKLKWNNDNFGPLFVPKEGSTITLTPENVALYSRSIINYENNTLETKNGKYFINGQEATTYTFRQDYYFMMGDNRHNSADSRAWGFVPGDHVVGTPVFVWMSIKEDNPNLTGGQNPSGFLKKLKRSLFDDPSRRARFFTVVREDGLSASFLMPFLIIVGAISGFVYFRNKRREKNQKK